MQARLRSAVGRRGAGRPQGRPAARRLTERGAGAPLVCAGPSWAARVASTGGQQERQAGRPPRKGARGPGERRQHQPQSHTEAGPEPLPHPPGAPQGAPRPSSPGRRAATAQAHLPGGAVGGVKSRKCAAPGPFPPNPPLESAWRPRPLAELGVAGQPVRAPPAALCSRYSLPSAAPSSRPGNFPPARRLPCLLCRRPGTPALAPVPWHPLNLCGPHRAVAPTCCDARFH